MVAPRAGNDCRLVDGERLVVHVEEPRAVVNAVDGDRESVPGELVEQRVHRSPPFAMPAKAAYCRFTQRPACRMTSTRNRASRSVKP